MTNTRSRILAPAPLFYAFVVIFQFASGAYRGAQLQFPEGMTLIYGAVILWAVGWWLSTDSSRRGVLAVYDIGFFLYLAWPLVMPYYLLKTRGAKGLLVILGFVVAYAGAAIVGMICSVLIVALRS